MRGGWGLGCVSTSCGSAGTSRAQKTLGPPPGLALPLHKKNSRLHAGVGPVNLAKVVHRVGLVEVSCGGGAGKRKKRVGQRKDMRAHMCAAQRPQRPRCRLFPPHHRTQTNPLGRVAGWGGGRGWRQRGNPKHRQLPCATRAPARIARPWRPRPPPTGSRARVCGRVVAGGCVSEGQLRTFFLGGGEESLGRSRVRRVQASARQTSRRMCAGGLRPLRTPKTHTPQRPVSSQPTHIP